MGVRLPSEYQEVEYIATGGSGNQYIATDILGQKDLIIESDQMPTYVDGDHYIFGWQGELYSGGTALQYLCHGGSFNTNYEGAYGSYFLVSNKIHNNIRYHVVSDFTSGNAKVYLDGSQIWSSTVVIPDFETERKFLLFSGMNRTGDPVYYWKGYLYSFCVKKQQRTIADFIPCYRKSDGEIGMFDLVLQKFYTNEGTGVFLKGSDVIDSISPWLVVRRRMLMNLLTEVETMKLIKTVTLTESYESDSNGNVQNFRDLLFDEYKTDPNNLYIAVFSNNSASSYHADVMYTAINSGAYSNGAYFRNNYNTLQSAFTSQYSFHASIGTIIKVYAAR